MSWVKLDDGFADHPKLEVLSDRAFRAHVGALCYSAKHLTDGMVPETVASRMASSRARDELVRVGLWEGVPGGYEIHDYLTYNPSRADVEGSREQARERMHDVRANVRANNGKGSPSPSRPVPNPKTKNVLRRFIEFWDAYPRHVGRRTAESAFARACSRAEPETIIEGAARFAADPNLPDPKFIPHPTTWLNRDGWEDDPIPGKPESLADRLEREGR